MLSIRNSVTFLIALIGFICSSASAETINLSRAKEVPAALTDVLQKLQGRELQLVDSSMENLNPKYEPSPITCEFLNKHGETFTVLEPSKSRENWRFATNLSDDHGIATVVLGETGGFTWIGLGGAFTSSDSSVTIEPGVLKFRDDFTYVGINTAIPGKISQNLEYVFELSSDDNLTGSIIIKSLTINGGGVHFKRVCSYLVR